MCHLEIFVTFDTGSIQQREAGKRHLLCALPQCGGRQHTKVVAIVLRHI